MVLSALPRGEKGRGAGDAPGLEKGNNAAVGRVVVALCLERPRSITMSPDGVDCRVLRRLRTERRDSWSLMFLR